MDDDGGFGRGAVWVMFHNTESMVKSHQKINETEGAFTGMLYGGDWFGNRPIERRVIPERLGSLYPCR